MIPRPPTRRRHDFSLATINIVFLLLMFFMIAGSIVQKVEVTVDIPLATKLPLENLPRPLLVVSYNNALFLDGVPVAAANLAQAAAASLVNKSGYVNILAERDLPARPLLDALDLLSRAGLPVRIVTLREDGGKGGSP